MSGRIPDRVIDREGLNKHRKYCYGIALQEKLAEDKAKRLEHLRNDLINKEEDK